MKTLKRMLMLGLAVVIVFLCLVGCAVPPDLAAGVEQAPQADSPNEPQDEAITSPIADAWELAPIVMIDGELYFSVTESAAAPTEVIGTVLSTVEQTALPEADWQTNCGFVGCEVYATDHADVVLLQDGESNLAFERPQPSEFAGSAPPDQSGLPPEDVVDSSYPPALMWKGLSFTLQGKHPTLDEIPTDVQEIGVVLRNSYRLSELDFSSNCGFVGCRVFRGHEKPNMLYIACNGEYWAFRFAG